MRYKEGLTVCPRGGEQDLPGAAMEENGARESPFQRHILISSPLYSSPICTPFWGSWLFCTVSAFTELQHSITPLGQYEGKWKQIHNRTECDGRCNCCGIFHKVHTWTCLVFSQTLYTMTFVPYFLVGKVLSKNWYMSLFWNHKAIISLHII